MAKPCGRILASQTWGHRSAPWGVLMKTENVTIYQKHNSFVELRQRQEGLQEKVLSRIKTLLDDLQCSNNRSGAFHTVLNRALQDIISHDEHGSPRLRLTPNVNEE